MNKSALVLSATAAILLAACGQQDTPAPAAPTTPTESAAPAAPVNTAGQSTYNRACAMCHASGAAGAPIPGNKDDWGPRIEQGMDILYTHSLEGFTGQKGMMPAKGGNPSLSDDEVKAAVDFMVERSR
jgi:cytochrome c5